MAPLFQRLVVSGVGVLGGSVCLAVRKRGLAGEIIGLGRDNAKLEAAKRLKIIDSYSTNPAEALARADALVLATPPRFIRESLRYIAGHVPLGAFVTDVGSVKAGIVAAGEGAFPSETLFIGSHPMAGTHETGAEHARADLFEGRACILTPTGRTEERAVRLATEFWTALGARIVTMDPATHDVLLASVSHLPHLAAAALMQLIARGANDAAMVDDISGDGLRDTTRIAASDPGVWSQIFGDNAPALGRELDQYIEILSDWRETLSQPTPDAAKLETMFAEGAMRRRALGPSKPSAPKAPALKAPALKTPAKKAAAKPAAKAQAKAPKKTAKAAVKTKKRAR